MRLAHRLPYLRLPAICLLLSGAILSGLLGAPASADVTPFKTPSGNIECYIGDSGTATDLQCAIFEFSAAPNQPRPANCSGAWGHTYVLLERGPVQMSCGGPGPKNTAPGVDVAPYGVSARWGGISCLSDTSGLRCQNADGHGFLLSRRVLEVW